MCILVFLFIFTSISYGNISFMAHRLLHDNKNFVQLCNVAYTYDQLNRLIKTDDFEQGYFDESFAYDAQGRIVAQRRDTSIAKNAGGEYAYYANTNRLKSVADGMGGTADDRITSDASNFVYDSEGNLIEDKSKKMRITYDWRGMPVEFVREIENGDSLKLMMMYDGNGKRISKTRLRKGTGSGEWPVEHVTHYTGIGTEIRTGNSGNGNETRVVVSLPQGLGRYGVEPAHYFDSMNTSFEWYLKNHLGSTMVVYRTTGTTAGPPMLQHAYDYRSYGEKIDLTVLTDKVTENYTGKELDDETELGYWGARYLDLMLGMWISVDPMRQFASPYLYAGNGANPVNGVDPNGNVFNDYGNQLFEYMKSTNFNGSKTLKFNMTRAHDDPDRYFNIKPVRISKIEPSAHNKPGFKKTYDVYFPVDKNADGTDLSIITYITAGHELNHPYTHMKAGHNDVGNVKTEKEFLDNLKKMADEPEPDKIYLDDYNSAKEMGVYDDE